MDRPISLSKTEPGWAAVRALYRHTLRLWIRLTFRERNRVSVETFGGTDLVMLPGVFNGVRLRTGAFLAETLDVAAIPPHARVLDLGTGSGIGALFAARRGASVIATDINPDAVRCARINALAHRLEHMIETRTGDLFASVAGERFDLILFNPPFYRGRPRSAGDAAWRSVDVFERFLQELPCHLARDGCALVVLSSDGDISGTLFSAGGLAVHPLRRCDLVNEILTVYEIRPRL